MPLWVLLVCLRASAVLAADSSCVAADDQLLIQKAVTQGKTKGMALSSRPECDALLAAAATFRTSSYANNQGARWALWRSGFHLEKEWTLGSVEGGRVFKTDYDAAAWWSKGNQCIIAFKGAEHSDDFANGGARESTTKWGTSGLHGGCVKELEPLVSQMNFDEIRAKCTGSLTVAGHSLGGALAQAFSLAINRNGDPLAAKLTVDFLYTFGAGSMILENSHNVNDKAADGCFAGGQFFEGSYDQNQDLFLDLVLGNPGYMPLRSKKTALITDDRHGGAFLHRYPWTPLLPVKSMEWQCGVDIPSEAKPIAIPPTYDPYGYWVAIHNPIRYGQDLQCPAW
mmetsp:Transcript_87091/g.186728  ORF Transcript_87091/g.186728 Transcript_87091/m.186728 type:complete len:340 (-) Transcript_87091:89-1108(-)